jgi:hypothetical protein
MTTIILKRTIPAIIFYSVATLSLAQEKVVSITSVKGGVVGVSLAKEFALGKMTTLQMEAGVLSGSIYYSSFDGWGNDLPLGVSVAPQFYYNFSKRVSYSRDTKNNSANYLSLPLFFNSSKSLGNRSSSESVALMPTWGLRRNLGDNFYFDFSIGYGARHFFGNNLSPRWESAGNLNVKFGFVLK